MGASCQPSQRGDCCGCGTAHSGGAGGCGQRCTSHQVASSCLSEVTAPGLAHPALSQCLVRGLLSSFSQRCLHRRGGGKAALVPVSPSQLHARGTRPSIGPSPRAAPSLWPLRWASGVGSFIFFFLQPKTLNSPCLVGLRVSSFFCSKPQSWRQLTRTAQTPSTTAA